MIKTPSDYFYNARFWAAELAIMAARFLGNAPNGVSYKSYILQRCDAKDWQALDVLFNDVWSKAPDEPWVHGIKGWGALCDLCSETWVFQDPH